MVLVVCHPFACKQQKGATMRIVEVTGGVDTHADNHVAAAIDGNGGLLGVESFPASQTGYEDLLVWLVGFGERQSVQGFHSASASSASFYSASPALPRWVLIKSCFSVSHLSLACLSPVSHLSLTCPSRG